MLASGSRSSSASGRAGAVAAAWLAAAAVLAAPAVAAEPAAAGALARMFPPPVAIERESVFLTDAEARRVAETAGAGVPSKLVTRWVARDPAPAGGALRATAYVDTHLVRTLPETLMIVVDPAGRVLRVEVLAFDEPRDYEPSERWFRQFDGRALDGDLALKRGIRALTGATLSSRAATDAVRRALAVHAVAPPGAGGSTP